ncbi:carboxylesterase family protein [Vibrio sp. PP-XX7]
MTLFGQSAGAESVAILLGTPQAKGLFHQAIMQSPPMQSVTLDEASHIASAFAKTLNISPTMADIARVPYDTLVKSVIEVGHAIQNNHDEWGRLSLGGTAFLPVVDHVLLPGTPMMNLVKHADPSIPAIVGSTDQAEIIFDAGDSLTVFRPSKYPRCWIRYI